VENGWAESAAAWIAEMGETGDGSRRFILDPPMLALAEAARPGRALDVGCGEGRFCRLLRDRGIDTIGIDPTNALLEEARCRDPGGAYQAGRAEALGFPDGAFDLVVSYLTLIDIPDAAAAIAEMVRVLAPGGTLLIANLAPHVTAAGPDGWTRDPDGTPRFCIDHYLRERAHWAAWRGIRVRNWHRPLATYMALLLEQGLVLRHFEEPAPRGGDPAWQERARRVPWFVVMAWQKPGA
jgi:SAM-dependent methyltransferase